MYIYLGNKNENKNKTYFVTKYYYIINDKNVCNYNINNIKDISFLTYFQKFNNK